MSSRILAAAFTLALVLPLASAWTAGAAASPTGGPSATTHHMADDGGHASRTAPRASSVTNVDRYFKKQWRFYMPALDRCASVTLSGRLQGKRILHTAPRNAKFTWWEDMRVVHPRYRVVTRDYYPGPPGPDCGALRSVETIRLKQMWKHEGCSPNITDVSVGYPWAIGASFGCGGDHDTAVGDRTYRRQPGRAMKGAVQPNDSTVIRFGNKYYNYVAPFTARVRMYVVVDRTVGGIKQEGDAARNATIRVAGS